MHRPEVGRVLFDKDEFSPAIAGGDFVGARTGEWINHDATAWCEGFNQRLADQHASAVVVSQTWVEVHRVNSRVRDALKARGLHGANDTTVQVILEKHSR